MTSLNFREFLKSITCQSECCKNNDVRTNGQGNSINFTLEVKEPKIIHVKDEETQPSPTHEQPNVQINEPRI
jgi:hypothetical protein